MSLKNKLIEHGFTIDKVTQLAGRITKQTLPVVFLETLPWNLDNLKIFHITKFCYLTIRTEGYDGKGVTQCHSCNKFHHTALPEVRRGLTRDCVIKRVEKHIALTAMCTDTWPITPNAHSFLSLVKVQKLQPTITPLY
ncbi:hypothetical protein TNCV_3420821 [Trichonephila clavipes]|nr:hypothetical protein TNCV_3420821 [Trichonephila clavipes]